jgi:alcohol dehydrogenase
LSCRDDLAASLHLEKLGVRDVTITTGLVDTFSVPQLMRLAANGRLDPSLFATHRFALGEAMTPTTRSPTRRTRER